MLPQNTRALIVAYYLSRYDQDAYDALGYGSVGRTHDTLASRLGVKATTLKNMRDEFDGHADNSRAGWYQSPLSRSRRAVVQLFGEMDETALRTVVVGMLGDASVDGIDLVEALSPSVPEEDEGRSYRQETGRRAEDLFQTYHARTGQPAPGTLIDRRDQEAGYDFEINEEGRAPIYVEVKGMKGRDGSLQFTSKEWATAALTGPRYVLALVATVEEEPDILLLHDPAHALTGRPRVQAVLRVHIDVASSEVRRIVDVRRADP